MYEHILIVDHDESGLGQLETILRPEGCRLSAALSPDAAFEIIENAPVDVALCDHRIRGLDGFELVAQIKRALPEVPVLLTAIDDSGDLAGEALERGAYGCLRKPFRAAEVHLALRRIRERSRLHQARALLDRELVREVGDRPIVAASTPMIELLEAMEAAAGISTPALISGEAGTGKQVVARAIHSQSPRRNGPFRAIRCDASVTNPVEAHLFGRLAANPRLRRRAELLEASGGTLYLEEIAELPLTAQDRLLQVLEDQTLVVAGEDDDRRIDVRIIASATGDLEDEVSSGRLRKALHEQIAQVHLQIPALRERREDIPLLVDHFLSHLRESLGGSVQAVADDALEFLTTYPWPGNVRELRTVMERAVLLAESNKISAAELPSDVTAPQPTAGKSPTADYSLRRGRRLAELKLIERALSATGGNRTHAAKLLEISHRALLYKIKEYGLSH